MNPPFPRLDGPRDPNPKISGPDHPSVDREVAA